MVWSRAPLALGAGNLPASVWGRVWGGTCEAHECCQVPALLLLSCRSTSPSLSLHVCEMGREYLNAFIRRAKGYNEVKMIAILYC